MIEKIEGFDIDVVYHRTRLYWVGTAVLLEPSDDESGVRIGNITWEATGDSPEEAMENVKEKVRGYILKYMKPREEEQKEA